ncbi:MAG: ABC transporter substrate-binding protein [Burkholderiales bacterium]|nr:ABC transporter substrate-binding protein [Burkholderiales bacterium]OJX07773.1 MAG: hypothetical protein BGO72_18700 [Burkholderiales bacterium 70-64]
MSTHIRSSLRRTVRPALCAISLAAASAAAGSGAWAAQEPPPVTMGVVTFLSGPSAEPFGVPARNAAELMIRALNAGEVPAPYDARGFGGAPIVMKLVDEAGATERQVDEYRKLVEDDDVDMVVGYVSSANCMAVAPLADELKRLTVLFGCGTPRIFEGASYRYLFRTGATTTMDSTAAALYVAETKPSLKKVSGINPDYAWDQGSWSAFEAAIKRLVPGVQIIRPQTYELLVGEYAPEISIARGAEVVHSSVWGSDAEALIEQGISRELFRRSTLVMTAGGPTITRLGTRVPDGTIVGARGPFAMFAPDTGLHRWFHDAYRKRYLVEPSYPAYKMAQAILGVKSAWEKAQAANGHTRPSQEQTATAFEHLSFEGPGGRVDMSRGKGHQAVQDTAYGTVRRGQLVDVRRYPAALTTPPDGVGSEEWIRTRFAATSPRGGDPESLATAIPNRGLATSFSAR